MKCPIRPAACQVEPEVSSPFSTSTESVQPSLTKWYKSPTPIAPPPITNTLACVFMS